MKSLKKVLMCAFVAVFCLTGCSFSVTKSVITSKEFESKAKDAGYDVSEITNQYDDYDFINSVTIARDLDNNYQVEFYDLKDESNAASMFATNKVSFEQSKGSGSVESSVELGNYATYSLTSNGEYMYICRVDNTFLYLRVSKDHKDKVSEFVDSLGY